MMRLATVLLFVLATALPVNAGTIDPHLDRSLVPAGCPACHRGHGEPRSPMLPGPQNDVCLSCHGTQTDLNRQVSGARLSASAAPGLIADQLAQPFVHPLSDQAFSRHEPGVVVCTSCHSPHRTSVVRDSGNEFVKAISTRDPSRFEYELCEECHGGQGVTTRSLLDISRLFDANSRSYHPVKVPARETSPSLDAGLSGREIDCTHCHGNSDPGGQRGLHGSAVRFVLRSAYTTLDGQDESVDTYRLCYECHDRDLVIDSPAFPEHRRHIVEQRASCATCHNPHGSVENRALIRFGEETTLAGVAPSMSTGLLAFESQVAGEGTCYVTCHGVDHGPEIYGGAPAGLAAPGSTPPIGPDGTASPARPGRPRKRDSRPKRE